MSRASGDRGHLASEASNPASAELERLSTGDALDLLRTEDARVIEALAAARDELAGVVDRAADALRGGGRILYVGAGTSGRLGVLDASECPPTFGVPEDTVVGVIAGGEDALRLGIEGAEDDEDAAASAMDTREVGALDLVIGIAAGGTTPFVHAALRRARSRGAATGFLACVPREQVPDDSDVGARLLVGPEVLAGSSRMKAGTVTKLALNAISTLAMVRLGKTYRGHMVDVRAFANAKLVDRGERLVVQFGEVDRARASHLLREADGWVKAAIVMARRGCGADEARALLDGSDGHLGPVIDGDG
ncbi:MAG: N-acetylmuramic acid 6-phosphate etherase [Planctomycetota bacterium]